MRTDPEGSQLANPHREPRIAIGIIYPTGSIYVTNKAALTNVPGNVVHGVLEDVSSVGRELSPLEARSTIASFSFSVVDVDGELTDELRAQLVAGEGAGRREVRVYTGDTDDFTDGTWSRVDTFVVDSVIQFDQGSYHFICSDRQRELRSRLFPSFSTRLTADLTDSATSVTVNSTDGFELVPHTASFSDAPSTSVLYFRIKKTGEVISATGTSGGNTFTGCTRGVFNTIAQAVDIDPSADLDRQPEVELVYYLEMPAPQMVYALLTGDILGTANSLPDGYHLGIDTSFVDEDTFTDIGTDLYDPSDVTEGLVLSFGTHRGLRETDGKRFIEEQLLFPMWTFLQISNDGKFGLRRLVRLLADAAPTVLIDEDTIMSHGSLDHQVGQVANRVLINWNHDGEKFTRQSEFKNLASLAAHGEGQTLEFDLLGVTVTRHTRETLRRIFNAMTDRYGAPPQTMDFELSSTLNGLQEGDVMRAVLPAVRDFAGASSLNRSFEVQSKSWNPRTGEVRAKGFGSTARVEPDEQDAGPAPPLADAWYSSEGVALSSVLTIVGNAITVNGNLAGNADLRSGIYYHLGNLTLNAGVTVTVNENVQLRVRGNLTINGRINGVGRGLDAIAETYVVGNPVSFTAPPPVQTVGTTGSSGGINYFSTFGQYRPRPGRYLGGAAALARPALGVVSGSLVGMPAELRGTPGMPGGVVVSFPSFNVEAVGGDGGDSGAGLAIVCRGVLSFGASGEIDLSGGDGTAPGTTAVGSRTVYAGAGAGGAPGSLLVILDGNDIPLPDLTGSFVAVMGETPQTGNQIEDELGIDLPSDPITGFDPGLSELDSWQSAFISMWVPNDIDLGDGDDEIVPAPTSLTASGSFRSAEIRWSSPPADKHDYIEVWRAPTNDRTGALLAFRGRADNYSEVSTSVITRYFWVRAAKAVVGGYSAWHPVSPTGGVGATYGDRGGGVGWSADSNGKPAGLRQGYSSASTPNRATLTLVNGAARIAATSAPTGNEFCTPAIPVSDAKTYQFTVHHGGTVASADGRYFRYEEYDSALPAGKTHIGNPSAVYEDVFVSSTDQQDAATNAAISTTSVTETFTYTPTAGTKFMSLAFWNFEPATTTELIVEWVALTELGSNVDLLPGVTSPTTTLGLNLEAATEVAFVQDASEAVNQAAAAPYFSVPFTLISTSLDLEVDDIVEVTAYFKSFVGIMTAGGGTLEVDHYAFVTGASGQTGYKLTTTAASFGRDGGVLIATASGLSGTVTAGLVSSLTASASLSNVLLSYVNLELRVTKVKR